MLLILMLNRSCNCWDYYRRGRCADKLSNYIGEKVETYKARNTSFRYFLRTSMEGEPIGDTSESTGYPTDFIYKYDYTCKEHSNPRE